MTPSLHPSPSWTIMDSSKVSDYLSCPRLYFYRHILGWSPDTPAHDLHFGSSWHCAREYQLLHGYDDIKGAFNAFLNEYRKEFDESTDSLYTPKDPTGVLAALQEFATRYADDLYENEVVELDGKKMTEISGTVPVSQSKSIHYRMDSIMRSRSDGKIFSWDHKTTHERYIISQRWAEAFHNSIQNGTYTHCLHCMFNIEDVKGVEFCGTGFGYLSRGSRNRPAGYHITLRRVPAFKTRQQMNAWLWLINDILYEIDTDMDRLSSCKEEDQVMMAFRMNPNSCTNYKGCIYHDFCLAWSNPLQHAYTPPLGFHIDFWDPSKMETTVKKNL